MIERSDRDSVTRGSSAWLAMSVLAMLMLWSGSGQALGPAVWTTDAAVCRTGKCGSPFTGAADENITDLLALARKQARNAAETASGDPVDGRGELVVTAQDLAVPGFGLPLVIERTYRSKAKFVGLLGTGWDLSLDQRIVEDPSCSGESLVTLSTGRVMSVRFRSTETAGDPRHYEILDDDKGAPLKLTRRSFRNSHGDVIGSEYTLDDGSGITRTFDRSGNLYRIADRAGHAISLSWSSHTRIAATFKECQGDITDLGRVWVTCNSTPLPEEFWRIDSITDTRRSTFFFRYDPSHRYLRCITRNASEAAGCSGALVEYRYRDPTFTEPRQYLKEVLDPLGHGPSYEYDTASWHEADPYVATAEVFRFCDSMCGYQYAQGHSYNQCGRVCDVVNDLSGAMPGLDGCESPRACARERMKVDYCDDYLPVSCYFNCLSKVSNPAGIQYGRLEDLDGNLTEIRDAEHRLVARNVYGQDPMDPSFDSVREQYLGDGAETAVQWAYYDLGVEHLRFAATGAPDPEFDYTRVTPIRGFIGYELCRCDGRDAGGRCSSLRPAAIALPRPDIDTGQVHSAIVDGQSRPYEGPAFAVVVSDSRGTARTQYFTNDWELLREVNHHVTDQEDPEQVDYVSAGGRRIGVRSADGIVTCRDADFFGRDLQVTTLPRAGSGASPDVWYRALRTDGLPDYEIAHLMTQPARTAWSYDGAGRVTKIEKDIRIVGGVTERNVTYMQYTDVFAQLEGAWMIVPAWAPSKVVSPERTTEYEYCTHELGGGSWDTCDSHPTATVVNPEGISTRTLASYDFFGRELTKGTWDAFVQHWYDGAGRPWASVRHVSGTADEYTYMSYGALALPSQINGRLTSTSIRYDVNGEIVYRNEGAADAEARAACWKRDLIGQKVLAEITPEGEMIKNTWDDAGRLIAVDRGYPTASELAEAWALPCAHNLDGNGDPKRAGRAGSYERVMRRRYALGLLTSETSAGLVATITGRDGFGRVTEMVDGESRRQRTGYDPAGQIEWKASLGAGQSPYGRPDPALTDPALASYQAFAYDLLGRETKRTTWQFAGGAPTGASLESVVTTERTCANRDPGAGPLVEPHCSITTTAGRGSSQPRVTEEVFDGAGRLVRKLLPGMTAPLVATWTTAFHVVCQAPSPNPGGAPITTTEDFDARLLTRSIRDASGSVIASYTRDVFGRITAATFEGGRVSGAGYDAFGRLRYSWSQVDANSVISTETRWDRDDRIIAVVDGEQQVTTFLYDALGRRYRTMQPDGMTTEVTEYAPGSARPLSTEQLPSGSVATIEYDAVGRQYRRELVNGQGLPAGRTVQTTRYDVFGLAHVLEVRAYAGSTLKYANTLTLEHDSAGSVLSESNDALGPALAVSQRYSPLGEPERTSVGPIMIERRFGPLGLEEISVDGRQVATASYLVPGVPYEIAFGTAGGGSQVVEKHAWDERGRLHELDAASYDAGTSVKSNVVDLRYQYGPDGVPRARTTRHGPAGAVSAVFQVDRIGRVIAKERRPGVVALSQGGNADLVAQFGCLPSSSALYVCNSAVAPSAYGRTYDLDARHNLRRIHVQGGGEMFDFDAANQVIRAQVRDGSGWHDVDVPSYDAAGSVAQAAGLHFTADGDGLLGGMEGIEYRLDALGRRIQEVSQAGVTNLVWSGQTLVGTATATSAAPVTSIGTLTSFKVHVGVGLDRHFAEYDALAGQLDFIHQGPDGSVVARSRPTGLNEGYVYSAFGEVTVVDASGAPTSAAPAGRILFQGQLLDPAAGTYWVRNREYDPRHGRFLSRDPLGVEGGLNLYSFVAARPLDHRDPLGLQSVDTTNSYPAAEASVGAMTPSAETVGREAAGSSRDDVDKVVPDQPATDRGAAVKPEAGDQFTAHRHPEVPDVHRNSPDARADALGAAMQRYVPALDTFTKAGVIVDGAVLAAVGVGAAVIWATPQTAGLLNLGTGAGAANQGGMLTFAHGTSEAYATSITEGGLNAEAAAAASKGGTALARGSFFAHPIGPPGSAGPGLQLAYEWGLRQCANPVVLIGQIPESLAAELTAAGGLQIMPVIGGPISQLVFNPSSFQAVNAAVNWLQMLRP